MLSILIPVYNFDVTALVSELQKQCEAASIVYEIICIDDASSVHFKKLNQDIQEISNCKLIFLNENIGRAAIRNKLAQEAQYAYVYFLDCDAKIENHRLIENYLKLLDEDTLISGGRIYQAEQPKENKYYLHWLWGKKRELFDASERMKDPVNHFLSNNFILSRKVVLQFPFDETIRGYGYEDVYFAHVLRMNEIKIKHIENPVIHEGLDENIALLNKFEEAAKNLIRLKAAAKQKNQPFIIKGKLITYWQVFDIPILKSIARIKAKVLLPLLKKNLLSANPYLKLLDLYRLLLLFRY